MIFELLSVILLLFIVNGFIWCFKRNNFWKNKNIPHIPSLPLLGNFSGIVLLQENVLDTFNRLYNHPAAKGQPFVGVMMFHKPTILVRDMELVKKILITDFNYFCDRHTGADPAYDPIGGNNLFQIKNPKWRHFRSKMTPLFTSGKVKQMFYMVEKVCKDLTEKITETKVFEARTLFSCYTVDVISLIAFGTESNCLKHPESSEFLLNANKSLLNTRWTKICFNSVFFLAEIFRYFKMSTFDPDFGEFLRRLFNEVMNSRTGTQSTKNDLVDALAAVKKEEVDNPLFNEDVLIAQAAVFFVAGFETSASTLTFIFHHLAEDESIQSKVRNEIKNALKKNDGKLSYETVMNELPYLESVIKETLRLYPPLPFLDRECVLPGYSLQPSSDFVIPKKMPVLIPVSAIQRDPEYFPNPDKFDPDRYTEQSSQAFLAFGIGPHNCIGERFAWMQIRLAIVSVVQRFNVSFVKGTRRPLKLDQTCILLRPTDKIDLEFTPIEL